ncbi:hypothetical protein [Clostridium cellulovorans]|uniref:Uncharacterized protein n=1 Tax=Clostridium cellulovorans (strain ATCC 35296 / DSM 3052 / OCM 3 / 743B) TaxID=573061 RepID=D9SW07_CLOC7|nr:hypothetical protein [Clostridium cellulovorans]ADL51151.1 hypothetical protein Clocel_1398 [Clostridium cellulovorans 743B]
MLQQRYNYDLYMIRRKVLRFVGASFHIYNPDGELQFYVNQKGFKLKEDIKIYTGEDMLEELIFIRARSVIDISAIYDVYDSITGEKIGALKRKGLKSILKDEWLILDCNDNEVGNIQEDSTALAIVRRFLTNLVPQAFIGTLQGQMVFEFRQKFNPFIQKIDIDFSLDKNKILDRRLAIATSVLLCAIEGRQN